MTTEQLSAVAQSIRERGYDTVTTLSNTTESAYIVAGQKNDAGGIDTVMNVRFSTHAKYGRRAGYQRDVRRFDIRTDRTSAKLHAQIDAALAMLPVVVGKVGVEHAVGGN